MNKVILVGRITRDLELRNTTNSSVVSFSLAVNRRFKQQGQPEADFINCVAWGKTAETMARYLHKGSLIAVEGRLQTRSYENQQGQRVYVTEVIVENFDFCESRNSTPGPFGPNGTNANGGYNQNQGYQSGGYANNGGYGQSNGGGYNGGNSYNNQNPYSQPSQPSYSAPVNPYANKTDASDDIDDDYDDDGFDISSDDLPF